ncbi:Flp pilus assembly protein CpaB [Parvularcula sp. LCG005]|uniref:Flp pilus assembly protein CpaB n=1 Tax=Parvularcula sp. LCG005 TaxID=3078805 RepID=UPI002942E484|nr:Flp pilus assembly protein CpaB [Parvularcula sp. LCG005]WOI53562.1 Flp pilus assembly protein CpaB [Parvularcula sp. LCG005]
MSKMRLLILLVAVLAGGAAFFLVSSDNPTADAVVNIVPQEKGPEMVRVLVAGRDFSQGAIIDPQGTKWVQWPKDAVPEFYVTEKNTKFYEELPQMRARTAIRENEPVFAQNVVQHGDRGMMAAIMTPGMRAISARMSAEQASGGFVLPGDRVDIFASMSSSGSADNGQGSGADMLLSNVRVLAIDQIYSTEGGESAIVGRTVTLEVAPSQVETFIRARDNMTLTFVLRSIFEDSAVEAIEQTTPDEVVVIRYGQG